METLLYSKKASDIFGYNTIKTIEGKEVVYTVMGDYTPEDFKDRYKWEDAEIVGHAQSANDITGYFPSEYEKYRRDMYKN